MKTSYNVVNAIICCAKEGRGLIIGNPGSLLVVESEEVQRPQHQHNIL